MKEISQVPAKLKHKVEDFIVEEIGEKWDAKISEEFTPNTAPNLGNLDTENTKEFLWCEMEKQDIEHIQAIKEISRLLNKSMDAIGYAGTKDKRAWTSQRISIATPDLEKLKIFTHPNIILKNFKWNKRKIKIGYLEANHFKITLRDIDKKDAMTTTKHIRNTEWFPNYFGPQRFGINGNNVKVGKLLLKRKWDEALREINNQESKNPLASLKRINRKTLLIIINAVQSKIFNDILKQALEEGLSFTNKGQTSCLLIGYKSRFYDGRLGEIEQQVLKNHDLTLEDFDLREISYLRMKGSFRKAVTEIKDLEIEISEDDKFPNSKKITLEFTLPSGVYATTFLENFFDFNSNIL